MRQFETDEAIVSFNDENTADLVQEKILEWFKDHECFNGESIMQSDATLLTAPSLLADIADEIYKFHHEWKED